MARRKTGMRLMAKIDCIGATFADNRAMGKNSLALMALSLFVLAQALPVRAQEPSVAVSGKLGYLSEWDVTATVVPHASGRRQEFSGPLTVRHTGICTTNGPVEM